MAKLIEVVNSVPLDLTANSWIIKEIQGMTGNDVVVILTDAAGARGFAVLDSGEVVQFKVDSDGNVTTNTITANLVTASFVGDLTSNDDAAHDYAAGHVDWTLSASEKKASLLIPSGSDAAANIIGPDENREYVVRNTTDYNIVIKADGGTGVTIATDKTAVVKYSSSLEDYVRVTADATH